MTRTLTWLVVLLPAVGTAQRPLSRFDREKAEWLLHERLPCLGCHRLDGNGGTIGPDLSGVANRRSAGFIAGMIADPQRSLPGSRMPRVPMPAEWARLVAAYLEQGRAARSAPQDPGLPAEAARPGAEAEGGALYQRLCASCHGAAGRGDGPNAANLPARPTAHADSAAMSKRPDDTLFDGIYAGGYTLNKSNFMPAWGETLTPEQIWSLVRYIRALCRCTGPEWGRDGKGR